MIDREDRDCVLMIVTLIDGENLVEFFAGIPDALVIATVSI
jgi:hypothetical protein